MTAAGIMAERKWSSAQGIPQNFINIWRIFHKIFAIDKSYTYKLDGITYVYLGKWLQIFLTWKRYNKLNLSLEKRSTNINFQTF